MKHMGIKGQNPLVAVMVLISGIVIFLVLYAFFSGPLGIIWGEAEDASTNPNKPNVQTGLSNVWMIIGTAAIVLVAIWFIVYLLKRESEAEVVFG